MDCLPIICITSFILINYLFICTSCIISNLVIHHASKILISVDQKSILI
nr:MAG TPA: hypothetical protein [Caudoviricetes sp.]